MRWVPARTVWASMVGLAVAAGALLLTGSPAAAEDRCDRLQESLENDDDYDLDDGGLGSGGFGDDDLDLDEYGDDPSDLGHYDDVTAVQECRADERAERDRTTRNIWLGVGTSTAGVAAAGARRHRRRRARTE
jgi:hypothetical protein